MADDPNVESSDEFVKRRQDEEGGGDQPTYAPGYDDDTQSPRPGSGDSPVTADEIKEKTEAINALKDQMTQRNYRHLQDENNLQQELDAIKAEASQKPPDPPVPTALPAPLTQSDKNGIAVAATNILKWGALLGLAYGLSRRSRNRNAIFKLGLGAALQGYYQGDNEMRDRALTMWEKNRQAIITQNREQIQTYNEIMLNRHLSMAQKIDVFKEQSALFQDARANDAANRGDFADLQKMIEEKRKLELAMEKHTRALADQWLGWVGLGKKDAQDYRRWIMDVKHGPDISKAKNEDEEHEIETRYPRSDMIKELSDAKAQEDLKHKADVAGEQETARLKAKQEFEKENPGDPNAPISDDKAKEMRDKIFGSGSD